MKMIVSCTLFLFLVVLVQGGDAKEKEPVQNTTPVPPKYVTLAKADGNGIIRIDCEGEGNLAHLKCDFTQVLIAKGTEAEIAKKRKEFKEESSAKIQRGDFQKVKNEFLGIAMMKQRQVLRGAISPEKKKYLATVTNMAQGIRKSSNRAELIKAIEGFEEFDNQCCTVSINSYKQGLERTSQYKWISSPGPQGRCNVVTRSTLESNDDNYLLWKYTTAMVSVDIDRKRNDMIDDWCGGIESNKPVVYSWDIPNESITDCKCMKYGW